MSENNTYVNPDTSDLEAKAQSPPNGAHNAEPEITPANMLAKLAVPVSARKADRACNYIIKRILNPLDVAVIYGASGQGKTFCMLSLGYLIARGEPICGHKTKPSAVLYVPYEGVSGLNKRLEALEAEYGDPGQHYQMLKLSPPLLHSFPHPANPQTKTTGTGIIIDACMALKESSGMEHSLIVIDTLAKAMGGGNENQQQDVGNFLDAIKKITGATGAAVILVHQPGKDADKGARGSSRFLCDAEIVASISNGAITLQKSRDDTADNVLSFKLEAVHLGCDVEGDKITTCIAKFSPNPGLLAGRKVFKPTPLGKRALEELKHLYDQKKDFKVTGADIGQPDAPFGERWRVVNLDDWQDRCREAGLTSSKEGETNRLRNKREWQAFKRARDNLDVAGGPIASFGDYVWLVSVNQSRKYH